MATATFHHTTEDEELNPPLHYPFLPPLYDPSIPHVMLLVGLPDQHYATPSGVVRRSIPMLLNNLESARAMIRGLEPFMGPGTEAFIRSYRRIWEVVWNPQALHETSYVEALRWGVLLRVRAYSASNFAETAQMKFTKREFVSGIATPVTSTPLNMSRSLASVSSRPPEYERLSRLATDGASTSGSIPEAVPETSLPSRRFIVYIANPSPPSLSTVPSSLSAISFAAGDPDGRTVSRELSALSGNRELSVLSGNRELSVLSVSRESRARSGIRESSARSATGHSARDVPRIRRRRGMRSLAAAAHSDALAEPPMPASAAPPMPVPGPSGLTMDADTWSTDVVIVWNDLGASEHAYTALPQARSRPASVHDRARDFDFDARADDEISINSAALSDVYSVAATLGDDTCV